MAASNFNKVDLPAPFGPSITQRSPSDTEKSMGPRMMRSPRRTETLRTARTFRVFISAYKILVFVLKPWHFHVNLAQWHKKLTLV